MPRNAIVACDVLSVRFRSFAARRQSELATYLTAPVVEIEYRKTS